MAMLRPRGVLLPVSTFDMMISFSSPTPSGGHDAIIAGQRIPFAAAA
jgi:hypothetical protein